jgi:glycosyltransferase involved in cell wall biosynthesis
MNSLTHPWQVNAKNNNLYCRDSSVPELTIVIPIFNQENGIIEVLRKIDTNTINSYDLILINDASTDSTLIMIDKYIEGLKKSEFSKVASVFLINNEVPIFETACDNQGFKLARTDYIIEIQSDIHIKEYGYDNKMIAAMRNLNLGAVSGRLAHQFSFLDRLGWVKYPLMKMRVRQGKILESVGLIGPSIFFSTNKKIIPSDICYVADTVARGPWLLKKKYLEELNYLDEKNFFLGNDDHDFHRRLRKIKNLKVGYVPIDIYSIASEGSTRRPRCGENERIYNWLKINKKGSFGFRWFIRTYRLKDEVLKLSISQ